MPITSKNNSANGDNRNLIVAYVVTIVLVAVLVFIMFNAGSWLSSNNVSAPQVFTPSQRVSEKDLRFGLFDDAKFLSLSPLLTDAERKQLEQSENPQPQTENPTGTVRPDTGAKRELRRSNPFLPF